MFFVLSAGEQLLGVAFSVGFLSGVKFEHFFVGFEFG